MPNPLHDEQFWTSILPRLHAFAEEMQQSYGAYAVKRVLGTQMDIAITVYPAAPKK